MTDSAHNISFQVHGDVDMLGFVYVHGGINPVDNPHEILGWDFRMVVDTGSSLTYLPCEGCTAKSCGEAGTKRHVNREHEVVRMRCSDHDCPYSEYKCSNTRLGMSDSCMMNESFSDGSSIQGQYVHANLNVSQFVSQQILGCATEMTGYRYSIADGVLGMGPGANLWNGNVGGWSMCLAPAGFPGGNLTIIPLDIEFSKDGVWVPLASLSETSNHWDRGYRVFLDTDSPLAIDNMPLIPKAGEKFSASIDTGSSFSWLSIELFNLAQYELSRYCAVDGHCAGNLKVEGDEKSMGCYDIGGADISRKRLFPSNDSLAILELEKELTSFPIMNLTFPGTGFDGNAEAYNFSISPREYFYNYTENVYCIGIMEDKSREFDTDVVLGVNVLRGVEVSFDFRKPDAQRVRFQPCIAEFSLFDLENDQELLLGMNSSNIDMTALVGGFFSGFFLLLAFVCCFCNLCRRNQAKYGQLDKFGIEEPRENGSDIPLSRVFSFGSLNDYDEDDADSDPGSICYRSEDSERMQDTFPKHDDFTALRSSPNSIDRSRTGSFTDSV